MKTEALNKIFSPEVHLSTKGTANEKGTGFGLLLCKEFIEKNGGQLEIKSEEGEGTEVKFNLKTIEKPANEEGTLSTTL
jgi:signal transduction histidine kinase